ncbi:MAG TPA: hypothetical protein VG734_23985 [Lacunisphaera sp.]|nr:hypothetical protein [Lacunisphaera sp.]
MGLSPGLDPLAARLRSEGFDAVVFRHGQWPEIAATLRQPGWSHRPLILIGHSYGADAAISIAEDLTRHRGQVDLLITLDPCLPPPVPESVKVCRNFYRSNGLRDILPVFRGVAVRPTAGARVDLANFDLHGDRRDLLEADTDHFKITSNTRVNEAILREVRAACETATLVASTP